MIYEFRKTLAFIIRKTNLRKYQPLVYHDKYRYLHTLSQSINMATIYCSVCGVNILRFNLCEHLSQGKEPIDIRNVSGSTSSNSSLITLSTSQLYQYHSFCAQHIDLGHCLVENCQVIHNYIASVSSKQKFCKQHQFLSDCFTSTCTTLRLWFMKQLYQKLQDDAASMYFSSSQIISSFN